MILTDTDELMPVQDMPTQEDEIEGSGEDPQIEAPVSESGFITRVKKVTELLITF